VLLSDGSLNWHYKAPSNTVHFAHAARVWQMTLC
jgi:hypothetical protein